MPAKPETRTLPYGSRHILRAYDTEKEFEWTRYGWSTPGTGWATPESAMRALGWRYVGPVLTETDVTEETSDAE